MKTRSQGGEAAPDGRSLDARATRRHAAVEELLAAIVFLLVPLRLFVGPVGPFRAPGLEGEGLYGQLFAGAMARRWLLGEASPGVADVAGGVPWWPVSAAGALLQAMLPVDPAWALGLVLALGVWLAGYGPWRLARRVLPGAPVWGAALAGVVAQTSPIVLRAIPGVELAALAVGPIALGLAHPRLALLGGLWSAPGAVVFALAGLLGRRPAWLIAGVPALALLIPASRLPGALHVLPPRDATVPAYVTEAGATFPLPPEEQAPIHDAARMTRTGLWIPAEVSPQVRGNLFLGPPPTPGAGRRGGEMPPGAALTPSGAALTPPDSIPALDGADPTPPTPPSVEERPWIGGLIVPLQRLHGGPAALVGLLLLLGIGAAGAARAPHRGPAPRVLAAAGLAALVVTTLLFGWQAAPGEAERDARAAAELAGLLDADTVAAIPGGGALAWAALVPALGALGVAALAGVRAVPLPLRVVFCAALALLGVPLENPRLVAPVASLPPDPIRSTLAELPGDRLIVFPAPQWPYLQGQRPAASTLWEAAATGKELELEGADPAAAALIGALTARTAVPVDIEAARTLWDARAAEPLRAARAAGWRYLLVDLDALPPLGRPRVDGWLAERAGMPVARDGARLLYDLAEGPAGAGSTPGQPSATPSHPPPGSPADLPPTAAPGHPPPPLAPPATASPPPSH